MGTVEKTSYKIQIIVALIGVAGVLGAAVISNLDKIFKKPETALLRTREEQHRASEESTADTEESKRKSVFKEETQERTFRDVKPDKPTPEAIEKRVIELISEQFGIDKSKIIREVSFVYDLNADELDKVELLMEYEDEFDMSIPEEEAEKFQTVGAVIDYIINAIQ